MLYFKDIHGPYFSRFENISYNKSNSIIQKEKLLKSRKCHNNQRKRQFRKWDHKYWFV